MLNVLVPAFRPASNGKLTISEIETDTIIVPRLEPMDRYGFASDLFAVSYKLFIRQFSSFVTFSALVFRLCYRTYLDLKMTNFLIRFSNAKFLSYCVLG